MGDIEEVRKQKGYKMVSISECLAKTGKKPIGVIWVDINKGDDDNPNYRSIIVAQEVNNYKRDNTFAATPPLEAIKVLLSCAVTNNIGYKNDKSEGMKM